MATKIKVMKKRIAKIGKEISKAEHEYNSIKRTLVPNDLTNNSRLSKNEMRRIRVRIEELKKENKKLMDEAFNF
tara:strand:+ start:404 stop:625 length:222 start_codon:yes stop_codon:yes gene_type:complete